MEWSGDQQVLFLVPCVLIGVIIGFLFDMFSGWFRGRAYRHRLFVADAVLGALSAVITFFGALVVMDGHLHPLLFFGLLIGFFLEHYTVGAILGRLLCRFHYLLVRFLRVVDRVMQRIMLRWRSLGGKCSKTAKKP